MDIINLAKEVEERYKRYLKTTFYFRDPEFRSSFEECLNSGQLSRGPFLEATPVFKRGQTPRILFPQILGFNPDEGFLKALQDNRPLYQHQEAAIKITAEENNIVVATGTGSGKTEAFLYPILLNLYQEYKSRSLCPGIRALILYPMNALANDQRERLGDICKRLGENNSGFHFTFGQYVGETPEDESDSRRHAREHITRRLPGELVLRSEMRNTPPHILLTNFSMLEYLLIRPDDSPLFDNGRAHWWKFLILDEAHQYRGSRGTEMAMLLRRLKQRVREGGRSMPFQCIATSATLLGGEKDIKAVAEFASNLFDEKFEENGIIIGETVPIPENSSKSLSIVDYQLLESALNGAQTHPDLEILANKVATTIVNIDESLAKIGVILLRDSRSIHLRKLITAKPTEVYDIANEVFSDLPEGQRIDLLSKLVGLLVRAVEPITGTPLLSARYHLFLKSLEGAFISYWPEKRVYLDRKGNENDAICFEVALCRECGQHYLVGRKNLKGNKVEEAIRDSSQPDFGATYLRPIDYTDNGEENKNGYGLAKILYLCIRCGEINKNEPKCGHNTYIRVVKEDPPDNEDRADQLAQCEVCGYNAAGRDPVRELVYGADGPNAVIATTLYQKLPENRKKVLAFTDGRQEAAFFAWYLEKSYKDILSRNMLLETVKKLSPLTTEGISLGELAIGLRDVFKEKRILPASKGNLELLRESWLNVYREFLTDEKRISLEGVGLIRWKIKLPEWYEIPDFLLNYPWSLKEEEVRDLIIIILDTMRTDRAIGLKVEKGVSVNWNDLELQGTQRSIELQDAIRSIGSPSKSSGRKSSLFVSWDGKEGKRVKLLTKFLVKVKNIEEGEAIKYSIDALREIWDNIRQCDENASLPSDRLLIPLEDTRILNPYWYRINLLNNEDLFTCNICGRIQTLSIGSICLRHRCPGVTEKTNSNDLKRNHYRLLYEENLPGSMRVEEHTAQLANEKAREFQRDFRRGAINVLSCSTTFELGVDLGDLDTIFLRNVPPEAFNYAQRVGRAGRRTGYPGFAITYCRRGSHDLYHFYEPQRMLTGTVNPPTLSLQNEKIIIRHCVAVVLSYFFRFYKERFEDVGGLFNSLQKPFLLEDLRRFMIKNQNEIERSLRAIVPASLITEIGLNDDSWITRILGENGRFCLAELEIIDDYKTITTLEKSAAEKGDYETAEWAQKRTQTILEEDVLSFLSRKAIIPKYGFPVDVVELDTQRTSQKQESFEVSLQRDLSIAIAEFAPTTKIVANKMEWTSYGLKKVAEKEWDRWWYARCKNHNSFERLTYKKEALHPTFDKCCEQMKIFQYIDPKFGFITNSQKPQEPKRRTSRVFTTRPYFAGFKDKQGDEIDFGDITLRPVSPGCLVILCEGRGGEGFYICNKCGAGFRKLEKHHKSPYEQDCGGTLEQVSLGHEFVTDVLEIQFHGYLQGNIEGLWFSYSLGYALVEGAAEVLEIPSTDLNITVAYKPDSPISPLIIYDNVPGGAGLVVRLQDRNTLLLCLKAAHKRVSGNCNCSESSSCYGCLRNYRNQFAHPYLSRGPVKYYLEKLLSKWK